MKKILVRADAHPGVGVGHLFRSVACAQYFKQRGMDVRFLTVPWRKELNDYLSAQPFEVRFLSLSAEECGSQRDLGLMCEELRDGFDWVLLDNYYFKEDFQEAARNSGARLLLIDDGAGNRCFPDIIVKYASQEDNFNVNIGDASRVLLGPRYVAIRRELIDFPQRGRQVLKNILVTLGGSSQKAFLAKVVRAITAVKEFKFQVKVVCGFSDSPETFSESFTDSGHKIEICKATLAVGPLYDWADLAMCAAGGTCWELCFFGISGVIGVLAEHQGPVAEKLDREGVFKSIGWYGKASEEKMTHMLKSLVEHPEQAQERRKKAMKLVDGKGSERIFNAMLQFDNTCVRAKET